MEIAKNAINNYCHDCGKEMKIQDKEIRNGVLLKYENGSEKLTAFKCDECFTKSQELKNYQPCEVYSRIVGYLRPVQQWNISKKQEFKERKEYVALKEYVAPIE